MSTRLGGVLALVVAACGNDVRRMPGEQGDGPPPPSDNPIDVAIWPRMVKAKLTDLPKASREELCRRISLDLVGVASECQGNTAEEMVRGFFDTPRFRERERRFWVRRIGADPTAMMGDHIADADRIIDDAAAGAITYDVMAARLVAHPIFAINRPVAEANDPTSTIERIFRVWLGRAPAFDEAADFVNLLRPWTRRFEDRYGIDFGYYVHPAALDPDVCKGVKAECTSTVFGEPVTISLAITASVPTGYQQTSARLFYYETVEGSVPAAIQDELEKPGRLLATRDEFWDEAADMALARMLGWWRSSANEPETVLPEVRRALATHFRAKPDLRELYVTVMTSLLYTTSADAPDDRPPWGTGPTKLIEPEQLLDTVATALERPLGFCDPHSDEAVGLDWYWPQRLRQPHPADWYGFGRDFYRETAQQLGGCLGAVGVPTQPGLPALLAHIDLANTLCATPSKMGEPTEMFARFLGRAPNAAEQAALAAATQACTGEAGCNLQRQTCGALMRSAAFLYY